MIPLIAAIIGILVVFAMWRFLDPNEDSQSKTRPNMPRPKLPSRSRQTAPDDDPEFLRQLSSKMPKRPNTHPEDDA
ncbi:hypothetical protein CLV47_11931 [Antricoccus suffuscus]|uniref:Uncharacterized protein n=1 Tax=Antricoccus suffuscus TaxID=1629062 RepID=A0A2T0ZRY3_9ACTN|nr:hypothetical protein [Antricoccus suffuscus]PRZ39085.1 hypothetical protein CLV47_11931 [Antricoccus suffuscus]